ncbi:transcription elongation factor A N-terminal and central domain-containing protein isoform X2 [Nerophis ophidion]|uniref:transcription elongation factor A N-terminal and central domain-containing protein isoform X2 n=1 Tax=Nerophis ophidion TaxID=159077 RepID=UPI002AE01031|nr:transcription elongation factor A N-terminal and central domain-containing protein isoform X2 [Nerophis ophidion]
MLLIRRSCAWTSFISKEEAGPAQAGSDTAGLPNATTSAQRAPPGAAEPPRQPPTAAMHPGEIARCASRLEKLHAGRSYGDILALVGDLDKSDVTAEHLEDIADVLYKLLKGCSDGGVRRAARALLSKWRRQHRKDLTGVRCSGDPEGAEGLDGGGSRLCHSSASSSPAGVDGSSVRSKCVQLLVSALSPEPGDPGKTTELAAEVELHIHRLHVPNQVKYKACVRSKVANLRNPKNGHLRHGLLGGRLPPEAFARMSAEEMACDELRRMRKEFSSRGVSERQLPLGPEGTETRKIRCERCGGSNCRVTQVSRGALFLPAWVRRGGPDDDSMTFVTCSGCGQQWYHSSWVCL